MKHTLALALACALALSLLSACTGNTGGSSAGQSGSGSSAPDVSQEDTSVSSRPLPDSSVPDAAQAGGASSAEDSPSDEALTLNRTDFSLFTAGSTFQLKVSLPDFMSGSSALTWESSNPAVATVSDAGLVTAVAPGSATITVSSYAGPSAACIVRCRWTESTASGSDESSGSSGSSSGSPSGSDSAGQVDLSAFYAAVAGSYEFPSFMQLAEPEVQDAFYPGLSDISTEQCLVYANMMSMNMGEFVLVQVKDSKDVDAVKSILQGRIDTMINGGAWYPEPTEVWTNQSAVVSNGNYVMMVVHEDYSSIVEDFNALF